MLNHRKFKLKRITAILMMLVLAFIPIRASGEVAPIEEAQEEIENISQEEMEVLEKLFMISKEMDAIRQEEDRIKEEIAGIMEQIASLEETIRKMQSDYDVKLGVLEQVLIYYQRGGPATYLEILLNAESFTQFLKSLNVLKDISHNVGELLTSLEEGRIALQEEKRQMDEKMAMLREKQEELERKWMEREQAKIKQEDYLSGLKEKRVYYEEQLQRLELLWENCKELFQNIVAETTRIIGEGYFTAEDLNLGMGLFALPGSIREDTFNRVLNDNSDMTETYFYFHDGEVTIEVPELQLVLQGNFFIAGEYAIQYEVTSGTFYELPLDEVSIARLFEKGSLVMDFNAIAGDMGTIDFALQEVESREGSLAFIIKLKW